MEKRNPAILLIGPTGSGKTPLGYLIEKKGLWGKRCPHFDFGENLRNIKNDKDQSGFLNRTERDIVLNSLETGSLLKDEHFPIAKKILTAFIEMNHVAPNDFLILNGLPRHRSQAKNMDALIDIKGVIHLQCPPHTILKRIQADTGGDRSGRTDDDPKDIQNKMKIFMERTEPLLKYYRSRHVTILKMEVRSDTMPEDIYSELSKKQPL